jgi:hypothetical protein
MTVILPDWFPSDPPPVCEYQTNPHSITDNETGETKYYRDYRSGLVWFMNRRTKPGEQIGLPWLAEQLNADPGYVFRRLCKLIESGDVTREHVTNSYGVQCDVFTLTPLGRTKQAAYDTAKEDE